MYFFYYVPIGINAPLRRFPTVTVAYAVVCICAFIGARYLDGRLPVDFYDLIYVPGVSGPLTVVTAAFVHFGYLHLIGNLLYLLLFGRYVEDRLGAGLFTFTFLSGAAIGNLAQGGFNANVLDIPFMGIVGASGAVSAMLGAFSVRFIRSRVRVAYWVFLPLQAYTRAGRAEIPALVGVLVWFGLQVVRGLVQVEGAAVNVAYVTHAAGFAWGVLIAVAAGQYREGVIEATLRDGDRYLRQGHTYAAQGAYIRYLSERPTDGAAYARLGRAMVISGNPQGAIRNYSRACALLLDDGRRGDAEAVYGEAVSGYPGFALDEAHQLSLGFGLERNLKPQLAVRAYRNFASRFPTHEEAPFVLLRAAGLLAGTLCEAEEARNCYAQLIDHYPEDRWVEFAMDQLNKLGHGPSGAASPVPAPLATR